jgi:hypothetical protein
LSKSFSDIEDHRYAEPPLKSWHGHIFKHLTDHEFEDKYEYNHKAEKLLRTFNFENDTHRRIWELHIEGLTSPEIEKQIRRMKNAKKQLTIRNIIKDLEREVV